MRVKGGKALYGASVGILMLDAQFPRIIGDMGNAQTWPFPVHYKIVRQASPDKVVRGQARDMLDNFIFSLPRRKYYQCPGKFFPAQLCQRFGSIFQMRQIAFWLMLLERREKLVLNTYNCVIRFNN